MSATKYETGDLVGERFVLVEPLGQGAFGTVWRAADCENNASPCALKILFEKHRSDKKKVQRFLQEGKILARLDHPNIARPIAFSTGEEEAYVAMELVDGEPLYARLESQAREERPIPLEGVSWLADQLCAAVAYAHEQHVVHRDLKPRNVMVNRRGQRPFLKVLDFGIAKVTVGSEIDPTTVGRMLGSLMYVAPEQLRGEAIDHRADIFALGTMFFELLTARRAWARDANAEPLAWKLGVGDPKLNSHLAIARRITRDERPRPTSARPDLSDSVDDVIVRALAVDPRDRFPSAAQFGIALRAALAESKHGLRKDHDAPTIETIEE